MARFCRSEISDSEQQTGLQSLQKPSESDGCCVMQSVTRMKPTQMTAVGMNMVTEKKEERKEKKCQTEIEVKGSKLLSMKLLWCWW